MKKTIAAVFAVVALTFTACGAQPKPNMQLELSQMKAICELSVMECYYHNVAKYSEEDAQKFLWWSKDKKFWIEYSGVVSLGVDVSQVDFELNGDEVIITLPPAKVLDCDVDSDSLTEDSYIVDAKSAKIDAADETTAFSEAQEKLEKSAAADTTLLAEAQQRTKTLLEDYVNNIGKAAGRTYTIKWNYLEGAYEEQEETLEIDEATTSE